MFVFLALSLLVDGDVFVKGASLQDALARAGREDKLVVVDVYTDWCGPCKLMDRTTFRDDAVAKVLRDDFVSIKINAEVGEGIAIAKKYKVYGYPCLLILDEQGEIVEKSLGFMDAKDMYKWLEPHR